MKLNKGELGLMEFLSVEITVAVSSLVNSCSGKMVLFQGWPKTTSLCAE